MDLFIQVSLVIVQTVLAGIVLFVFERRQKTKDKAEEIRESERARLGSLELSLIIATAQLSYATTMALKRGKTNGEVEVAEKSYEKAMNEFREFEREQLIKHTIDN